MRGGGLPPSSSGRACTAGAPASRLRVRVLKDGGGPVASPHCFASRRRARAQPTLRRQRKRAARARLLIMMRGSINQREAERVSASGTHFWRNEPTLQKRNRYRAGCFVSHSKGQSNRPLPVISLLFTGTGCIRRVLHTQAM